MDGDSACPVVSPAILQQVENLPPCTNPDFDLGMSEFCMTQSSSANESQVGMKRCRLVARWTIRLIRSDFVRVFKRIESLLKRVFRL